jgi:TolB-like protein
MKARHALVLLVLMTTPAAAQDVPAPQAPVPAPTRQNAYTAQQKPRVAVMQFENTNELAKQQKYGESVSAMLITFLKRKSQLVVVERQNLEKVLTEWKLDTSGITGAASADRQKELEVIDAILDGRVTVLGEKGNEEIEIDARLISKNDAHIISAGHQRGRTSMLRTVVEMLGIELEHGFLRPYFGSLTVTISEPTNVRVYLTPVLSIKASDDEKPPIELDQTVSPQARQVLYDKWVTVPTVATISNLLGGWYTIRVDRPGFEGLGTDNSKLVVQDSLAQLMPTGLNGAPPTPEQQRFLVHIKPFESTTWPNEGRSMRLAKKSGSIALQVKREFLDRDYRPAGEITDLKTWLRAEPAGTAPASSALLDMNNRDDLAGAIAMDGEAVSAASVLVQKKLDSATSCTFSQARPVLDEFSGGRLLIEDYHRLADAAARKLPVGTYRAMATLPNYAIGRTTSAFDVADKFDGRPVTLDLRRLRGKITVFRTEAPSPEHHLIFEGQETKFKRSVALDFTKEKTFVDFPVDQYVVTTDQPGFATWRGVFDLEAGAVKTEVDSAEIGACGVTLTAPADPTFGFDLKSQPWLAGRLEMNRFTSENLSRRPEFMRLLEDVMRTEEARRPTTGQTANDALLVGRARTSAAEAQSKQAIDVLRSYLQDIDLLYLNDSDIRRILRLPQTAGLIRDYVAKGGALFCFVSSPGDYTSLLGANLSFAAKPTRHGDLELRPGDVSQVRLNIKLGLTANREFPTLRVSNKEPLKDWRVLAYRRTGRKEPAIIERGDLNSGGYVVVWLDSARNLEPHPLTEETLSAVEKRAIAWSVYLMYRRLGPASQDRQQAQGNLQTLTFNASGEAKLMPGGAGRGYSTPGPGIPVPTGRGRGGPPER